MKNDVFFYQGNHSAGAYFFYDVDEKILAVVTTHYVDFDDDYGNLSLKKLEQFKVYKRLANVEVDEIENGCEVLLITMQKEAEAMFKF